MTRGARFAARAGACGLALPLLLVAAPARGDGLASAAPGERGVLEAADAGARVVVGRTAEPRHLDAHGYIADLRIEQVPGGAKSAGVKPGATIRVVWEELSTSRQVRFGAGDRVLLCLEALPTASIWRKRLPTPAERSGVLVVAGRGDAFVRDPSAATVYALDHYLAMARPEREAAAGLAYVVDLVASASPGLAAEALAVLAAREDLAVRLATGSQIALVSVANNRERPEKLRIAVIETAGRRRLSAARPELEGLASAGPPTDAAAWNAIGLLDDGLPEDRVGELLDSHRSELRVVGVRFVEADDLPERVGPLVTADDSPDVRTAAVDRLLDELGAAALDATLPALGDPDDEARAIAAARIGREGADVVPALAAVVDAEPGERSEREREGAIVALSFAGPSGTTELGRIHTEHPDERLRKLAGLALGRFPGHEH